MAAPLIEVRSAIKRAVGQQEYDAFIKDTLLKVTPATKYALVAGAIVAAICAVAFAIFALYAQAALFTSLFIVNAFGAHYYPRRDLDAIVLELSDRVIQLQVEDQEKAKSAEIVRNQGDEKRGHSLRSKEEDENQFQAERIAKEREAFKKAREEELKYLEQLQKSLGITLPRASISQQIEGERIALIRTALLARTSAMQKEIIEQQKMIEALESDDLKRKILILKHTVQRILACQPLLNESY